MTTDERFDRIEGLIERFSQRTDERFTGIDERLGRIDQRFDSTDGRLDRMDQRFDGMDVRFDRIDGRLDRTDQRFDGMDIRFDRIDDRFERVDAAIERFSRHTTERFQTLTQYVSDLRDESTMRLDLIDSRMGLMNLTLANIDPSARLPG
jgi:archaellum component FlaC